MSLSVVMIAKNEESRIARSLESIRWADEIVVVDSGSTDRTKEIAQQFTSKVMDHPFQDFSSQKNFAITQATKAWVLVLDADETVPESLAHEIHEIITANLCEKVYAVGRINYFFGKPLRFSGSQNDYPIRLFPRGQAYFYQPVHEEVKTYLEIKRLKHKLFHHTTYDFENYQMKMDRYIPLEIETMKKENRSSSLIHLLLRPVGRFIRSYFIDLGILDGKIGFLFAFLSGYYTLVKYQRYRKIHE